MPNLIPIRNQVLKVLESLSYPLPPHLLQIKKVNVKKQSLDPWDNDPFQIFKLLQKKQS
jgi:hypothetical protein